MVESLMNCKTLSDGELMRDLTVIEEAELEESLRYSGNPTFNHTNDSLTHIKENEDHQ